MRYELTDHEWTAKPLPYVDTLYARELRADSTAVSIFSFNHTYPPAWTANYYTIHLEGFNAPWPPTSPGATDGRIPPPKTINSEKLEVPFTAS